MIYNAVGQWMETIAVEDPFNLNVDVADYPKGMYFLQLQSDGEVVRNGKVTVK